MRLPNLLPTKRLARRPADRLARPPAEPPLIRARVALVEAGAIVTAPDGTRVRGLARDDFRIFEDGVEQKIASFDAATTPASIVLVLDTSPSISRDLGDMRTAAQSLSRSLQPEDEVAVVAFANETNLLLPFSRDRKLLAAALFFSGPEPRGKLLGIVHLPSRLPRSRGTPGGTCWAQSHGIGHRWAGQRAGAELGSWQHAAQTRHGESAGVRRCGEELAADGVELYAISTENRPAAMTAAWLAAHRDQVLVTPEAQRMGMPPYTLYLAEMVRQVGGSLYFLHELGSLAEVYHRIALALGAEYTLGYYPWVGVARSGWRALRVEMNPGAKRVPPGAQLTYRDTYYVPALP